MLLESVTLDQIAYRVLPQVAPGRALADAEWRTLRAAADTLLDDLPFAITAERAADNLERFLIDGRSKRAWRCRILFTLLEHLPRTVTGRPFSALSRKERRELFEQRIVTGTGLWGLCGKVRYLVFVGAYGDHSAREVLRVRAPQRRPQTPKRARLPVFELTR